MPHLFKLGGPPEGLLLGQPASSTPSLTSGLYAYYKLDEGANVNAPDAAGSGGTLSQFGGTGNLASSGSGVINSCRSWDGTQNISLKAGSSSLFSPGSSHFSCTMWVWLNNLTQAADTGLWSKANAGATYAYISWYRPGDTKFHFGSSTNGTALNTVVDWTSSAVANTWYFLACGWDGNNIWLSVNGAARVTTPFAGPIPSTSDAVNIGFEDGSGGNFNGLIDESGFWMRDLSDREIGLLYNSGAGLAFSQFGSTGTTTPLLGQAGILIPPGLAPGTVAPVIIPSVAFPLLPLHKFKITSIPQGSDSGIVGSSAFVWTQQVTTDFFLCTSGQGHAGADIASFAPYNTQWTAVLGAGHLMACNGGANGGVNLANNAHCLYYWSGFTFGANQFAQVTLQAVPTTTTSGGCAVRVQSSGENCYILTMNANSGNLELVKNNNGTLTVLNSVARTYSAGAKLRLEVIGAGSAARLTGYEDTGSGFTAVWSSIDPGATYIDGGSPGMWGNATSGGVTLDDFAAGDGSVAAGVVMQLGIPAIQNKPLSPPPSMPVQVGGNLFTQSYTATLSFVGALANRTSKSLSATLSFAGALIKKVIDGGFTATLSFVGNFAASKLAFKALTATLSFVGNFSASKSILKALTATLSFVGGQTKSLLDSGFTATLSFTGAIKRSVSHGMTATLSFVSAQTKKLLDSGFTATLSFVGNLAVSKSFLKALTATLSFAGNMTTAVVHVFTKSLTATLSFVGNLATVKAIGRALTATLSFAGSIKRTPGKGFAATISFSVATKKAIGKKISAVLSFVATMFRGGASVVYADQKKGSSLTAVKTGSQLTMEKTQ